jgi:hypothetical protein
MLDQKPTMGQLHIMQRDHLVNGHMQKMEKILQANSHKKKYWIMGTAKWKRKQATGTRKGHTIIVPHLEAFDFMPPVTKESYLYEVDNEMGTRTLLWVMHPNNKLALPTLEKTIHAAG